MFKWLKSLFTVSPQDQEASRCKVTQQTLDGALDRINAREPPLIRAIMAGDKNLVARMLSEGANHNTKTADGSANAVMVAKLYGQSEIVALLNEHKKMLAKKSRAVQKQRELQKMKDSRTEQSPDGSNSNQ